MNELIRATILGIVEGATEFIPVSSTGHLIVTGHWLGFTGPRAALFEIVIQLGAILAVVWQYRAMLTRMVRDIVVVNEETPAARRLALTIAIAFVPAAGIGFFVHDWITENLFRPITVAWALVLGGIAMLAVERWKPEPRVHATPEIPLRLALGIGFAQVLSLFPGVSRSAATIMGGMSLGLARPQATEFSFLLAIPIMFAATGLGLVTGRDLLRAEDLPVFAVGFVTAFLSALVAIRFLLRLVAKYSFASFAWYRIIFGGMLLVALTQGWLTL